MRRIPVPFLSTLEPASFAPIAGHFHPRSARRRAGLSRGERAGLSLAITLAPEPELLILDDPAIGLDPVARRSLLESMIYVTRGGDARSSSRHICSTTWSGCPHIAILDRSVLRASGLDRQPYAPACSCSVLRFDPLTSAPPATRALPPIRGLLHARRGDNELRLIVAAPDDDTRRVVRSLGASAVDEAPIGFADAMTGYLGDRGQQGFHLDEPALEPAGGQA